MSDFLSVISYNAQKYPLMSPADAVKLVFQSEFGTGHFLNSSFYAILNRLDEEFRLLDSFEYPLFESLGDKFSRLNLSSWDNNLPRWLIAKAFLAASGKQTDDRGFHSKLELLFDVDFPSFNANELKLYIAEYKNIFPSVLSHSQTYRSAYHPHYRVVGREFELFFQLIKTISLSPKPVFIAIDGMCASGKTTLASYLSNIFDCNIFHADDFFLPAGMRSAERLSSPGGNIHYERLKSEIIENVISRKNSFSYGVFDCFQMKITQLTPVKLKDVNILEGSYSSHPYFCDAFDIRVFLKTSPDKQKHRIINRNSEKAYADFQNIWIPHENSYFKAFDIESNADFVFYS